MNTAAIRQPLRPGTEIEYCDMHGVVVADFGGETLTVRCEGYTSTWRWKFEGVTCKVLKTPDGDLFYKSFDDYVKDFPQGERTRDWLTNRGRNEVWMYRLVDPPHEGSPHGGISGNYMAVSVSRQPDHIRLAAHDCDDGLMVRDFPLDQEPLVRQVLAELGELAPFSMWDAAKVFGFAWE